MSNAGKILVVDDDPVEREIFEKALSEKGMQVSYGNERRRGSVATEQ